MPSELDLKKQLKPLYNPPTKEVSMVDVPPLNYLMIDGAGDPNTAAIYPQAVKALYTLAYGIRAISKAAGVVYTVMPLEGLWSFRDAPPNTPFDMTKADKARFIWTMMILQPDHVTEAMVEQARQGAIRKKVPLGEQVRFETYHEGKAVQIMHIGSYDDEAPNVAKLHDFIETQGSSLSLRHHEIYLSDPNRVAAEKLKTVIRQPFSV